MTSFICLHVTQMHLLEQVSYGSGEQRSQDLHSRVAAGAAEHQPKRKPKLSGGFQQHCNALLALAC